MDPKKQKESSVNGQRPFLMGVYCVACVLPRSSVPVFPVPSGTCPGAG